MTRARGANHVVDVKSCPGSPCGDPAHRKPDRGQGDLRSVQSFCAPPTTARCARWGENGARLSSPSHALSLGVVLRACRPRQWTKNLLLLAAPVAAGVITRAGVALDVAVAVVAFCMLSSATYLLIDVRDRAYDRLHPRKRGRPVASGELSPRAALVIAAGLAISGLALAAAVRIELAAAGRLFGAAGELFVVVAPCDRRGHSRDRRGVRAARRCRRRRDGRRAVTVVSPRNLMRCDLRRRRQALRRALRRRSRSQPPRRSSPTRCGRFGGPSTDRGMRSRSRWW